jgi:hypothetical protein
MRSVALTQHYARTAALVVVHIERGVKNFAKQRRIVDFGGTADAQALALVQQDDAVGELRGEIELMRDDDNGGAAFVGKAAQATQQFNFAADIEMLRRLVEQEKRSLLRHGARENHALLLAAGELVHPAFAERVGAHLREAVRGEDNVFCGFEAKPLAVRIAALQHVLPNVDREEKFALLLYEGDALRAGAKIESAEVDAIDLSVAA